MALATHQSRRSIAPRNGRLREPVSLDEAILQTATALFARHGYRCTDVQVVADALKVGKGSVYRRYPTKQALFQAAADRGMRMLHEAVDSALAPFKDELDQIAAAIRAYLDFYAAHPDLVELLIQERAEFRERAKPTYFAHREANLGRWTQLYRRQMAAGRVRRMPVRRITDCVSGLVYGTMLINFFTGQRASSAAQARDILDVVFHGILTPREQAARLRRERQR